MPKLPALTPREVIRLLEGRGFVLKRVKGSHHIFFHSQTRRRVVVPVHRKELPRGTLMAIMREAGIDRSELT